MRHMRRFNKMMVLLLLTTPSVVYAQENGAVEKTSDLTVEVGGRFLYDVVDVEAPDSVNVAGLGTSDEIRRARLAVSGTIADTVDYKVEADFAGDFVELTNVYLKYKTGDVALTLGQHNNFQSMEELTSSNDSSFIERAAFTDAFGFSRKLGLSAEYGSGDWTLQAGVFLDNLTERANDDTNVDVRTFYAPQSGDTQLHLGASAHYTWRGDDNRSARYRQRPLVHATDVRFINTGRLPNADNEKRIGLEAGFISGRLHGLAEAQWLDTGIDGAEDTQLWGGSAELGIYLTSDTRRYSSGVFKGVEVANPVGKGGIGAIQINIRYDWLDLNDASAGVVGGTQDGVMASLIWTPVDQVRFMANYGRLYYSDAAIPAGTDRDYAVNVFGFRSQFKF